MPGIQEQDMSQHVWSEVEPIDKDGLPESTTWYHCNQCDCGFPVATDLGPIDLNAVFRDFLKINKVLFEDCDVCIASNIFNS